ncbi:MAG TPA: hypothetical protein VKD22_13250, partial [Ramlibacter sp.]|nr:hypothetical protein [Ramlibacter sp.]
RELVRAVGAFRLDVSVPSELAAEEARVLIEQAKQKSRIESGSAARASEPALQPPTPRGDHGITEADGAGKLPRRSKAPPAGQDGEWEQF